jgi:hypothetical protein
MELYMQGVDLLGEQWWFASREHFQVENYDDYFCSPRQRIRQNA